MKKLVQESLAGFQRELDPRKAMGIGYAGKLATKAWKVLDFIGSRGEEGASLTEIQHFVWTKIKGYSEKEFWEKDGYGRKTRGWWTDPLYGSGSLPVGLLKKYCVKNDKGKWVLVHMPNHDENIF